MRKQNSEFLTAFTSEASNSIKNTDYFGFVELDDYACYVIADGIDDELEALSAKLAVAAAVSAFSENPSISKKTMKKCLYAANKQLLEAKSKTKLKASIMIVLTNYVKLRYGQAGNIRLRLYRNGFLEEKTIDQSLTMDMVKEEKVPQDKVAAHEERNNLYTYLGQEQNFNPYISNLIKLNNADAVALYTRGIWEYIDEGELEDVFKDATNDPEETVNNLEELLLSRQPKDLKKYTFAVIFINKVFIDPNKKRKIRRIIMTAIPILVMVLTISVIVFIFYKNREEKKQKLQNGYTDTIEYIQINNYVKAEEYCNNAEKLAEELKDQKMQKELGNCRKLIEAILAAEEKLEKEAYTEAQLSYQDAAKRARYADNLGLDYINQRLELTADYISVYDMISLGDTLMLNLQYKAAEEKYLEAKALSVRIYFDKGRTAAIDALEKLYEAQKEQEEAEKEARQEQLMKEEAAANHLAQGDVAYAQSDYESAKVYYHLALQKYKELEDEIQQSVIAEKITITENKISVNEKKKTEAEGYVNQAFDAVNSGDYIAARKYYLLAKDIYASIKDNEKLDEIDRKLEVLDIKESEQKKQEQEELADLQSVEDENL